MIGLLRRHATGLVVGALAATLALEVAFLASALGILPFAPFALALGIVDVTPGPVSTVLIDLLQFWAKRLVELAVLTFTVGAGALAGAYAARGAARSRVLLIAAAPWVLDALAALVFAARQFDPLGTALAGALALAVYLVALRAMSGAFLPAPPDATRRRIVVGAGATAAVLAVADLGLASLLRRGEASVGAQLALQRTPSITAPPFAPEDPAFDATAGLSPQLTSNRDFYVVDTALIKPRVDVKQWRLRVDGAVERPYELTYDELLEMDAVEQVETLECISNPVGGDLISTAKWVGVRAADLLHRARLKSEAFDLVMTSHDEYTDSIPILKALEPTTLLAYGMNDEVLPVDHGFPARMLIPNIYGMKNVKWVVRLTVATFDYRGYWQERGWSDTAVILTNARIDVPERRVRWSGGPVRVAGIAFAGARGTQRVEVSVDGGATWQEAKLGREVNPFTWRRWLFDWTPSGPGDVRLVVRAIDGAGVPQVASRREPFPSGATGYHLVPVRIERA